MTVGIPLKQRNQAKHCNTQTYCHFESAPEIYFVLIENKIPSLFFFLTSFTHSVLMLGVLKPFWLSQILCQIMLIKCMCVCIYIYIYIYIYINYIRLISRDDVFETIHHLFIPLSGFILIFCFYITMTMIVDCIAIWKAEKKKHGSFK